MRSIFCNLISILFFASTVLYAQNNSIKDIALIYAEGKIDANKYTNDYFGLTLSAGSGRFTEGGFLSPVGKRARLIDVQADADNWDDKFEIAVLADLMTQHPQIQSSKQYIHSLRQSFEKQGMETYKESSTIVSNLPFAYVVMKINNRTQIHYRAIYTTLLKGYIFSLDVSAATPEKVSEALRQVTLKDE
jgi:hypothetical protein